MENMELKEELYAGSTRPDTEAGEQFKKDWELNIKAKPFEPNFKKSENELMISTFEQSVNTTSDSSPKSPELEEHQSTVNNLVKQLNSAKAEIDKLEEQLSLFTKFKMPFKLKQTEL